MRRLVRDLDLPIEIAGCPTVRETDALAMPSRNACLSTTERQIAPLLATVLSETARQLAGHVLPEDAISKAKSKLLGAGFRNIEYLELRYEDDLTPLATLNRPVRLLAALWLGQTRLIDNVPLRPLSVD
ncbi:pantoate--beta-alanine ligase [Microvirga sp. VF16]|uniref:pantoate--beta-alanine ligase n=1 Tax=Microvirga sp. VF16 TaxID=2807101 RepID=UPI00353019D5